VDVDYVFWKDQLWSPSRTFAEVRWWAFANDMPEAKFLERFGEDARPAFKPTEERKNDTQTYKDPLARCRVWEIWSKEKEAVYWFVEGRKETLDQKPDPLELEGFWPFPRPMFANLTTSKLLPTPDFIIAQDLYNGIDALESRIVLLEDAIRVAGVYDSSNEGIQRLITEKGENALYPVNNWAIFAEKGGLEGAVSWLPLEMIVSALDKLRECRTEKIQLLFQVTGMSDIMRGQASLSRLPPPSRRSRRGSRQCGCRPCKTSSPASAEMCSGSRRRSLPSASTGTRSCSRRTSSSCRRGTSSSPRRRWSCSCPEGSTSGSRSTPTRSP
jgi:hypothetical protein